MSAAVALMLCTGSAPALADTPTDDETAMTATVTSPGYPVLTRGQVVVVHAQRLVLTQEPPPAARVGEAPPERPGITDAGRPAAPSGGAIWVDGHWAYGPTGFSWVTGRYVARRPGHVFVPPRWASLGEEYLFFTGFYVPYGVYVRSYFNRYYYSGLPRGAVQATQGPYWPIGAPTRANSPLVREGANDPYWPIGARR
jgi:hypothetical protein